jgi:hypothetical protein
LAPLPSSEKVVEMPKEEPVKPAAQSLKDPEIVTKPTEPVV